MKIVRTFRLILRQECGQALVLGALAMVVVCGFAAMAIDVGMFLQERRDLQKTADAAALAGAQELPFDTAAAVARANEWLIKNGFGGVAQDDGDGGSAAGSTIQISTTFYPDDTITVSVARDKPFVFGTVLGLTGDTISADATARVGSPAGMSGLVPWAVEEEALQQSIDTGEPVVLEFGSPGAGQGNFGGIVLDAPGGSEYEENIMYGADQMICSVNQIPIPGCETAVKPQTGNQAQLMSQNEGAVVWRLTNTSATCSDFNNVFTPTGDGLYEMNAGCNPFGPSVESCDQVQSCLVVPVVVITEFPEGSSDYMDVQTFAMFFLESFDPASCNPASCQVTGTFVDARASLPTLLGSFDPGSSFHFVRLVD